MVFQVRHPLYITWKNMRQRCNNPRHPRYKYYGARGITICDRWNEFTLFVEDMGERPEGHTLDRINPSGNYEPANCRWATQLVQVTNQRPRHNRSRQTCPKVANDPMRYITVRSNRYRVVKYINKQVVNKTFISLDDALEFRANLEMEAEMHSLLTTPYL